jgi:hypothetical protein
MKRSILLFACLCCVFFSLNAQTPRYDLIDGFYQDQVFQDEVLNKCLDDQTWGNCVTIATIKAAIATFGSIPNIYQEYRWLNDTLNITFHDGVKIQLSRRDTSEARKWFGVLAEANGWNHLDSAAIVFSSVCMRAFVRRNIYSDSLCIKSYHDAIGFINSGYATKNAGELLGVKLIPIKVRNISVNKAAIIYSTAHAAFCSYGMQDDQGDRYKVKHLLLISLMKNPMGWASNIVGAFVLKKR